MRIRAFILFVVVLASSVVHAQAPPRLSTVAAVEAGGLPVEPVSDPVRLLVGRSTIVDVGRPVARVSLTSADVADALVTSPNELLVNGKMPGTISMFVWDRAGAIRRYEIAGGARLTDRFKQLFPQESIDVRANGKSIVLSGVVSSKDAADKMTSLAGSFVDNKDELISLLQIAATGRSNQVLLRVRFAEVSRSALTQLGSTFFTGPGGFKGEGTVGQVSTEQFPVPSFSDFVKGQAPPGDGPLNQTFSDFLNFFLFNNKYNIGTVISALQNQGLFQSLAEPNVVAESGKEASFLAGGEFPVPIAQASGGGTSISVQFKEFGIRLTFTPTVIGDRVHLKVRPEVSTLDFSNAVTLNGFRIPALSTRRTETEVELNDGQTFAIAGLLNNAMNSTLQKIPGIGDIPILGLLFKSKAAQRNQTELVVMITPEILSNNSPGVTPNLPRQPEQYLPPLQEKHSIEPPPPAFRQGGTQSGIAVPATTAAAAAPAKGAPSAQTAAAILTANSPGRRGATVHINAPAAPQEAPAPAASAPAADASTTTPLTSRQQKDLDHQKAEEAKRVKAQADRDAAAAKKQAELVAKAAKKQAEIDAKAAKKQAE